LFDELGKKLMRYKRIGWPDSGRQMMIFSWVNRFKISQMNEFFAKNILNFLIIYKQN